MFAELDISLEQVTPTAGAILEGQGIPASSGSDRTLNLAEQAVAEFRRLAVPDAITGEITLSDFQKVYIGEGRNAVPGVLEQILAAAGHLTLFACTLGQPISDAIGGLFEHNDFAAGAMLDAAASSGADLLADSVEQSCTQRLRAAGNLGEDEDILRFSPGYCGWHISGQKKFFGVLRPERIGIELNESYLMQPLKSISGVLVVAPWKAFDIDDTFPFCLDCKTHSCHDRFADIRKRHSL